MSDVSNLKDHDETVSQLGQPNQIACFGMICDSQAQLFDDRTVVEKSGLLTTTPTEEIVPVQHVFRDNAVVVHLDQETELAVIDRATIDTLLLVGKVAGCDFDMFIESQAFSDLVSEYKQGGKKIRFTVSTVFYGPRESRDKVGKFLSDAHLYLQHPSHRRPGVLAYDNPHIFDFGDSNVGLTVPPAVPTSQGWDEGHELERIFRSLDHQTELQPQALPNGLVRSELKSHQLQGVSFIAQREGRKPLQLSSLWTPSSINGISCYTHRVTGTRTINPDSELIGGILADEMGVGKTLTTLAAIAESIQDSSNFAEEASSAMKPNTKATLVIAPSVLVIEEWLSDIKDHLHHNELRVLKHHSNSKATAVEELLSYDIVLSTYATLSADLKGKTNLPYRVNWFRVVLDEAHFIRHQQTRQFQAVAHLSARYRWCLTGTPIQNSLSDLGSLVNFLRIPLLHGKSDFNKSIVKPIKEQNTVASLRQLLTSICLRRTKEHIGLKAPQERVCEIHLSPEEKHVYDQAGAQARLLLDEAVSSSKGLMGNNVSLRTVTLLRRICNHGTLEQDTQGQIPNEAMVSGESVEDGFDTLEAKVCSQCGCEVDTGYTTVRKAFICVDCYNDGAGTKGRGKKNRKGGQSTSVVGADNFRARLTSETPWKASKISALINDVDKHRTSDKCIIFSSWTTTLDIVAHALDQRGIKFGRIDGKVGAVGRAHILKKFQDDGQITALIMTLGTSAVGLNIKAATRVHILEPQWNPFVEQQAIGRAVRLGQTRTVRVIRYIVPSSIETHITARQANKISLSKVGFDEDGEGHKNVMRNLVVCPLQSPRMLMYDL
ncbi:P-loop containing nucleoside triphosphate hydrolase protein [Triangularia verruculosa]|uniref:P-loop containing nucleoside triphosphate hydrolase protein n=1 Tax=Triangularia verruculosa TaxID=2587418 RepID=A0AAN6XRV7_9PEZI|nr:P-loop containing nucleoside triphosphate hydrolase protein [Triangularia verruculosa]